MESKQGTGNPEGTDRNKLDDRIEDLPPRKLGVKQDEAVKGGVGYRFLAGKRLPDEFP